MHYRYATQKEDYTHYASGKVFYALPGQPAFPIRLASEVWQRCLALRAAQGRHEPAHLYDPCCGGAYHVSALGYLHGDTIAQITASDINADILSLAQRNLDLLTEAGLRQRLTEVTDLYHRYQKTSHAAAIASAQILLSHLRTTTPIQTRLLAADATNQQELVSQLKGAKIDVVFTDVPYGWHLDWITAVSGQPNNPIWHMLNALHPILSPGAIVAIATDKQQKAAHLSYQQKQRLRAGKRQIFILQRV